MKKIILTLAAVTIFTTSSKAQTYLINENFEGGTTSENSFSNNGLVWNWNLLYGEVAPVEPETYGASTASWRDMPSIHGGFELSSAPDPQGSTWSVSVNVINSISPSIGLIGNISFDAGYRDKITSGFFQVINISKDVYLVSPQAINDIFTTNTWNAKSYSFDFSNVDLGDNIILEWFDSPTTGSNGLEVGPVIFSVQSVPEPSTYALFGIGALALVIAYRRRNLCKAMAGPAKVA